jgi:hypothetical protein
VVAGDWLLINGTYAKAASATANAITLASNFAGTTGSSLTITKSAQAAWLRENQSISSLNHAGTARKELVRYTEGDTWKFDEDAVGVTFGSRISFGANGTASPSDTLTSGWRSVMYDGGAGGRSGFGVGSGEVWYMASAAAHKFYVGGSNSPILAMSLDPSSNLAVSGKVTIGTFIDETQATVTLTNGPNDNVNIGNASIIRITGPTAAFSITGFSGGEAGRVLTIWNFTAQPMTLRSDNGGSTPANRVYTIINANGDVSSTTNGSAILKYSAIDNRWIVASFNK